MTRFVGLPDVRGALKKSWVQGLLGAAVALGCLFTTPGEASAETRTLKLYFIHTKEKAEIVYKRNGRYDQKGLQQINKFLRDWRRNEPTKMDPRLLDVVWEVYRGTGSREYINVVSAYRSPATNSMLRSRSKGVANKSQHMLGKAMDFYIPGVKLATLRNLGLKAGAGGVGYYPKSGSPFVHLDVGNVRHWPRMSRSQLMAVFPKGDTMHVGTDGKPLPGYNQALAAYKSRQKGGSQIALASASGGSSGRKGGGFLSAFFGGGADDEEDSSAALTEVASAHARARPSRNRAAEEVEAAPVEAQEAPAAAEPETIVAALPARVPLPGVAPRQPSASDAADARETLLAALAPTPEQPRAAAAAATAAANQLDPKKAVEEAIAAGASVPVLEAPFQDETAVAFQVPLPTRRPDYQPTASDLPETAPILVAAADQRPQSSEGPTLSNALVDAAAPTVTAAAVQEGKLSQTEVAEVAQAAAKSGLNPTAIVAAQAGADDASGLATAYAAVPTARPGARTPGNVMAALAAATIEPGEETAAQPIVARNEIILPASETDGAPSQRIAMLETGETAEPLVGAGTEVRTTSKSAKPRKADAKAAPVPQTLQAAPGDARWALNPEQVATNSRGTQAPSYAYKIVRTAPSEVYTAGFQQGDQGQVANRFSGKAVEFLSVARFN